ncbi:hypothetical protein LXL04_025261 [Taraxacum kok-saghyz]
MDILMPRPPLYTLVRHAATCSQVKGSFSAARRGGLGFVIRFAPRSRIDGRIGNVVGGGIEILEEGVKKADENMNKSKLKSFVWNHFELEKVKGTQMAVYHMFFNCDLAVDIWKVVAIWFNGVFPFSSSIKEWLTRIDNRRWKKDTKKHMEIIIITISWMIWRFRNVTV